MKTPLLPGLLALFFALRISAADAPPRIERDVAYLAPGRAEKLDIYFPENPAPGKLLPAVVWIHGGGWTGGDKGEARGTEICTTLAKAGYFAVSINYRLGDGAWPTDLIDCKNAVRFVRAHAAEYHVDPARIAVAGGSAGGHLSLMVGLTAGKKEFEPDAPYPGLSSAVRCVIDMYGITNLAVHGETNAKGEPTATRQLMNRSLKAFDAANDEAAVFRVASPIAYIAKGAPPILIFHGTADTTVDYSQSELLVRMFKERGVEPELVTIEGVGHAFNWEQSGTTPLPRDLRPVALAFLEKHLGPAAAK